MMTTIKNLLTLVLISIVTVANATNIELPNVSVEQAGTKKVKLSLTNIQNEKAFLSIIDADETIVYYETIREDSVYTKIFNLNALTEGAYVIRVEFSDRIIEENAMVVNNELALGQVHVFTKPTFTIAKNSVSVQLSSVLPTGIDVKIYNSNGDLVYEETNESVFNLSKRFVLEQLERGNYTVWVIANDNAYQQTVTVK